MEAKLLKAAIVLLEAAYPIDKEAANYGLNKTIHEIIADLETEVGVIERESKSYKITSIHRDDLVKFGFDVENITDAQMEKLASKMGDDYCEQLFWPSAEIIADILEFPKTRICQLGFQEINKDEAINEYKQKREVYAFDTRDESEFLIQDKEDCTTIETEEEFIETLDYILKGGDLKLVIEV